MNIQNRTTLTKVQKQSNTHLVLKYYLHITQILYILTIKKNHRSLNYLNTQSSHQRKLQTKDKIAEFSQ